jgi:hypothetical protein
MVSFLVEIEKEKAHFKTVISSNKWSKNTNLSLFYRIQKIELFFDKLKFKTIKTAFFTVILLIKSKTEKKRFIPKNRVQLMLSVLVYQTN